MIRRLSDLPLVLILTVSFLVSINTASAAPVPNFDKTVLINAREQPIGLFLSELFGQVGVPVQVEDNIVGSVNGDFRKPAREVFDDIDASFHLMMYYDGAVAHIAPSRSLLRNILYMPEGSARKIKRSVDKMAMADKNNMVEVSGVGLVVTGAEKFVQQIENLSNAMRKKPTRTSSPEQETYKIFKLRYAWADDVSLAIGGETVVVPGVASLLRSLIEPGSFAPPASTVRTLDSPTLDGLRGQGLQAVSTGNGLSDNAANGKQTAVADAKTGKWSSGSTSRTRIVADPLSNSVIIRDRADRMSSYQSLIDSLDKEPKMIEIEATIIDLDSDRMRELGIDWRLVNEDDAAVVGNPQTLQSDNLNPGGSGGVLSLVLGSQQQFISRIRALESQGVARIVSKPHVMTLSNVEASLDTTSTFFVRVAGQEEVDLFDISVGTTLRVTPHVYEHNGVSQIKLRVNIQDGSRSEARSVDSIPTVDRSTINTQAIIDVGQSLLIGGLIRENRANGVSRVPLLGSIPGVGALFRSRSKTSSRQERMFLITPRLSSGTVQGKRYSAPILSGTESDIIGSSATRMNATRNALTLLDEAHPLAQVLPRGDTLNTGDASLIEPYRSVLTEQQPQSEDQKPSLRDRLMRPLQAPVQQRAQLATQPSEASRAKPEREPLVSQTVGTSAYEAAGDPLVDGWQTVQPAPKLVQVRNDSRAAHEINADYSAAPVTVDDGWQEITQ